ncbi:hypothetical protein VTL71DRAFT_244 [Oculimacula yallundae]|uniref:NACHT domain-containing protein n=1 Tax=Oculimacula yallundae TaxID=86028 RepID=A0ABR4D1S3_9HELO
MASSTSTEAIFKEAHTTFLTLLSPKERSLFSSCSCADELLADAQKLAVVSKNRVRGRRFMGRIKAFSDGLAPYFEVVGIIVQSNPEYAALAWGGVRLVLQLASNYATFFDKLTRTLERLSHHIPQYELIVGLYNGRYLDQFAQRITVSLREVYVDIFQFLQRVARVFTRRDGKTKYRPVVVTSLIWKPFDACFDEILQQMESHRTVLKEVVELDQIRSSVEARDRAERGWTEIASEHHDAEKARDFQADSFHKSEAERLEQQEERKRAETARLDDAEHRFAQARELKLAADARVAARNAQENLTTLKREVEQAQRDEIVSRARAWLSPPDFAQDYEKALVAREEDTAEWLFDDPMVESWKKSTFTYSTQGRFEQECLWVQGNPGYGKTVLAANAMSELKSEIESTWSPSSTALLPDVLYFFFRSGISTMNSSAAAHRALLAQILQTHRKDNAVLDQFMFAIEDTSSGQMIATEEEMNELLRVYTKYSGRECFIVLDGIDECSENENLIQSLLRLKQDSEVRMMLFSRPDVAALVRTVSTEQQLLISRKTSADIEVYLNRKIALLQHERLLPANANTSQLVGHLLTGADGMFLWARLMVSYLKCSALTRSQRVAVIEHVILPEGLEAMYDRIGDLIGQGYQIEQNLARRVIIWLTFTERRLTARELQGAIVSSPDRQNVTEDVEDIEEDLEEFTKMVVMTCRGLIETERLRSPVDGHMSTFFRFIHLSAFEYFTGQEGRSKSVFSPTAWDAHIEITCVCLYFLTFGLPAQPLSKELGSNATMNDLSSAFPFCNYAALHWTGHLEATRFDPSQTVGDSAPTTRDHFDRLLRSLSSLLSKSLNLMSWIEASYVYGKDPPYEQLKQWLRWARSLEELDVPKGHDWVHLCDDIAELARYLPEIYEYWGSTLMKTPGSLWEEVIAFTPCRLLPQTSSATIHSLITENPNSDYMSTQYLCKISESSLNGRVLGVLSVWPSRDYQEFTKQKKKHVSLRKLRDLSIGWVAKYEIWALTSEPWCTVNHLFSLDATEVWIQMRQTMCQREADPGASGIWGMQFPMAISKDARTFTVLRTLYSVKPATSKPGLILESIVLDIDFDGLKTPHWSALDSRVSNDDALLKSSQLDEDERFERRDLYLYWFFFHPDGRSLIFASQDLQTRSMAAIFKLDSTSQPSLFNSGELNIQGSLLRHPSWCRNFNQVQVIYHAAYPLLGFSFAGRLYLWAFNNPAEKPFPVCEIHPDPKIQFSDCGQDIIFSEPLEGRMRRTPIPHRLLQSQQVVATWNPASTELSPGSWKKDTHWKSPSAGTRDIQRRRSPGLNARTNQTLDTFHSPDNSLHLRLRQDRYGSSQDSLEIAKLPSWAGKRMANVSVQMPKSRDEMVKIVLNKAAKPWYGMSDPVDNHLPAFVQRDLGSMNLGIEDRGTGQLEGTGPDYTQSADVLTEIAGRSKTVLRQKPNDCYSAL